MKQLIAFSPDFNPTAKTLDFTSYPGFRTDKLYAVINTTQNVIIYAPGVSGLGGSTSSNLSVLTLQYDTSLHNSSDQLNVYYDTAGGWNHYSVVGDDDNTAQEQGGNLQRLYEMMSQMVVEQQLTNFLLVQMAAGLNIKEDELNQLRSDLTTNATQEFRQ